MSSQQRKSPKPKRRELTPEEKELDAFFSWFKLAYPGVLAFHVPNEGRRARHVAKRIGIVSGVPDIFIESARSVYFGLRIEMKRTDKKSVMQESQIQMITLYNKLGYASAFCWGWEEAQALTRQYMSLEPRKIEVPVISLRPIDLGRSGA